MEFGELLKQFLIDLQSLFRSHAKDLKITLPQVMLISSIPTDGIDMTSLAHQIGVDNSTMTRLIGVLVKDRIVDRKKNPRDGRSMLVFLTKKGESLQSKIELKIDKFGSDLFRKVPMEDQEEVKDILSTFHWIVSKYRLND